MSGGISAIKGFDYQAIVILSRLFDHFDQHGASAVVRPEGIDDLDLIWKADGKKYRQYEQIKKPTEDKKGNLNPTPWTLAKAIEELLPKTIAHLSGNTDSQVWILGDAVRANLEALIRAGISAPNAAPDAYWATVHGIAYNESIRTVTLAPSAKQALRNAVPADLPLDVSEALSRLGVEFSNVAITLGATNVAFEYRQKIATLHDHLPAVLARIRILATYGTEQDVKRAVLERLENTYSLQRSVVENCLLNNLTAFINEIAKQPGRTFDRNEFEFELRNVWPHMLPIRDPPVLSPNHIARADLVARFTTNWSGKALEAVGISGSGKTMLAAEVVEHSRVVDPGRLVYYAQVRAPVSLRDVLVGVAFHLRRLGIVEPFAVSVEHGPAEQEVLARLARSYSALSQPISLIIDLVDGTCSQSFARDLATFIRALLPSDFRTAVLGQESGLRELTAAEREEHGVKRFDLRGFRFDEFLTLVEHHHPKPDRGVLRDIYERVTAGRVAGLFAKLADSLARTASLERMSQLAARPADQMLANAEQERFARISGSARSAAEKLVCFALPFRRRDAEEIFADENIGAAVWELLTQGLLRALDDDTYEMHETVRAGLEGTIALNVRRSAHSALAAWYASREMRAAQVLHLEEAGRSAEAQRVAHDTFLEGKHWAALAAYVKARNLISADELVSAMIGPNLAQDHYLFPGLLHELDGLPPIDKLLQTLREQRDRFSMDYQWGLAIIQAILDFDPGRLNDLLVLALDEIPSDNRELALNCLLTAARRKGVVIGSDTLEFFKRQSPEVKRLLLPFLLLRARRDTMQAAFKFLVEDDSAPVASQRTSVFPHIALQIARRDDAVEFLAAMPVVQAAAMLRTRSALFGPLAELVWAQRTSLRSYCLEILQDGTAEEAVLLNAMRVLMFIGEPSMSALAARLIGRDDAVGAFAKLMPALVPASCDRSRCEAQLLDCGLPVQDRMSALLMLAASGAELGGLYARVKAVETDTKGAEKWESAFLMLSIQAPFREAIPLLEKRLESADAQALNLLVPALLKLGELPAREATALLTRALSHGDARVRQCAAIGLALRRSGAALPSLIDRYAKEPVAELAVGLAIAIIASGPKSMADFPANRNDSPSTQLWQCILAMRLCATEFADRLVSLATDPTQNWQLRRAAIFAAGRLPYEAALERIAPVVLTERSPLSIDVNVGLQCHAVLSSILLRTPDVIAAMFGRGRDAFVEFFADPLEQSWSETSYPQGLPTGADAAAWLYDRLSYRGWPVQPSAPDSVLNELNIPLLHGAVLRSYRLCGRPDLIEDQLPKAYHAWFAMKCLLERSRAGARDPGLGERLKNLIDASPCKGNERLHRAITEMAGVPTVSSPPPTPAPNAPEAGGTPPVTYISYDEVTRLLSGLDTDLKPGGTFVLEPLDIEQCERLIRMADPVNDPDRGIETYVPSIEFTHAGHTVARRRVTYTGGETGRALIRPAIATANRFGLPNPWHEELLTGRLSAGYVPRFLACLAALEDGELFYEVLGRYENILVPFLCDPRHVKMALKYVDTRIAPFLARHVTLGTDALFEGLCTLALHVDAPTIDPVLSSLLYRFAQRFDVHAPVLQHLDNHALWRGFNQLSKHPRFTMIKGWQSTLAPVLQAPMMWFHAASIVRVLERDPRSYILIESRLFKAASWDHFVQDEIDRLDDAGEKLFHQLLES